MMLMMDPFQKDDDDDEIKQTMDPVDAETHTVKTVKRIGRRHRWQTSTGSDNPPNENNSSTVCHRRDYDWWDDVSCD
jgi:hypothetical protein